MQRGGPVALPREARNAPVGLVGRSEIRSKRPLISALGVARLALVVPEKAERGM